MPFTDIRSIRRHTPPLGWQYIIAVLSSGKVEHMNFLERSLFHSSFLEFFVLSLSQLYHTLINRGPCTVGSLFITKMLSQFSYSRYHGEKIYGFIFSSVVLNCVLNAFTLLVNATNMAGYNFSNSFCKLTEARKATNL